jgi:hypothetical protein
MQRDLHPLPTHTNTQHEAGGPNIRAITSKCSSGSKTSVYFPNLYFMVARTSVAQEGLKVGVRPRWWAYGYTLFEFEKRRAIPNAFLALSTINCGDHQCLSVRTRVCSYGIGPERFNRISWNLVALQHICCFYYVPAFRGEKKKYSDAWKPRDKII